MSGTFITIGKFDPTARTGIQRDLLTSRIFDVEARTVATYCVSPADSFDVSLIPAPIVFSQLKGLMNSTVGCLKIGSLMGSEMMNVIADYIESEALDIPLVLEPIMRSARGKKLLLDQEAMQTYERRLFFRAHLLCPNITEAKHLTGLEIRDKDSMIHAAQMLMTLGNRAVFLSGGNLFIGPNVLDVYVDENTTHVFESPRLADKTPEGTGDVLTGAIASAIAAGHTCFEAVKIGHAHVQKMIETYAKEMRRQAS